MDYSPEVAVTAQPGQQVVSPSQTVIQINQTTINTNPFLPRGPPRPWSSEMCACCDDVAICLCTAFFPSCHLCCMASDMNESCMFPCCAGHLPALLAMRAIVRGRHNIQGNLCNDCLLTVCCMHCTQCQLAREINNIKGGQALP